MTSDVKKRQRLNLQKLESQLQQGSRTQLQQDSRTQLQQDSNTTTSNERKKSKSPPSKSNDDLMKTATSSTTHRLWTRAVVIVSVMILVYFYSKNQAARETKFALVRENLPLRMQKFRCSPSFEQEMQKYPQCVPQQCGRFVADQLVEAIEADTLLDLAKHLIANAGSTGGASVLDLHSGALSHGEHFLNVYSNPKLMQLIRKEHLAVYKLVKSKIKHAIAEQFGISASHLYLTHPTFFSRFTNETAKTVHDEYWHEHIDKETYPSFHYTSLLYLNTFNKDFKGGRFVFVDGIAENKTTSAIEPKKTRLSAFTSGEENRHHVEKVTQGERFAITISFSCDKRYAIADPEIKTGQ